MDRPGRSFDPRALDDLLQAHLGLRIVLLHHLFLHLDDPVQINLPQCPGSTDLLHGAPLLEQNLVNGRRSAAVHLCDLGTAVILVMVQLPDRHLLSHKQVPLAIALFHMRLDHRLLHGKLRRGLLHSGLGHCAEKDTGYLG